MVADGFYERVGPPKVRLPYRVVMADGSPMTFAGIWEVNCGLNVESFAILTTSANAEMQTLHDRMPVILRPAISSAGWTPSGRRTTCPRPRRLRRGGSSGSIPR